MHKKVARLLAAFLGATAVLFVTTACWYYAYRPEVPEELLRK